MDILIQESSFHLELAIACRKVGLLVVVVLLIQVADQSYYDT